MTSSTPSVSSMLELLPPKKDVGLLKTLLVPESLPDQAELAKILTSPPPSTLRQFQTAPLVRGVAFIACARADFAA